MKLIEQTKNDIKKILTEFIAFWFAFMDRRVRWYTKIIILIPLGYIISPLDLIPDSILFVGQLDDLLVIRISYVVLKKMIAAEVLEDCRGMAQVFMNERKQRRFKFIFIVSILWIVVITFLALYIVKKMRRHGL
jgi:uncharacterized membrane protein YkvA (DUF1232 family)